MDKVYGRRYRMRAVTQEHPMGCAVACVASVANISYKNALEFLGREHASGRGYYCREIVDALAANGLKYEFRKADRSSRKYMKESRTIVFIAPSARYHAGHYLVRAREGWMNPWINYPCIAPAKSGFQKRLPGRAEWVIFRRRS